MRRGERARTTLSRVGFTDPAHAEEQLATLGAHAEALLPALGRAADPDLALAGLLRIAEEVEDRETMLAAVSGDEGTALRLLAVLGASAALGDHLARYPEHWRELADADLAVTRAPAFHLRAGLLRAVGADPADPEPVATRPDGEAVDALRVEYRRALLRLVARDLAHDQGVDDTAAELSDLAAGTLEAALAVARARVGEASREVRLAVIALGKCGGHELNYVSDVDVVFVHEPVDGADENDATRVATRLAGHLMRVCSDNTAEGTIWPVDANLRPEGRQGPLVRTVASHRSYYERWAATWEFQALLKARPVAGDAALGREYAAMVEPLVWQAAERENFVADVQAMRRRVIDHIPAQEADRQLKLGSGGLRDVEFAVQLLQLVHGRADPAVRAPTTLSALHDLTDGGYVGRPDGESMHAAYAFLRTLEHRIQLHQLRRTHVVPEHVDRLRCLARSMGYVKEPVAELDRAWAHHRREVRRLHEKLFYRPLLAAVARIPGDGARLSTEQAGDRLAALGFVDPVSALRTLEALTAGVSRTASIQRTLLPVMLEWFADAPDPDAGLAGFRKLSDELGSTPWFLATLRDEGQVAQRLATILATSRYAADLLRREPAGVKMLGEELTPLSAEALTEEMAAIGARRDEAEEAVRRVRAVRRRELLRVASGELVGVTDVAEVGAALARLTDATLGATLEIAERAVREAKGLAEAPTAMAIVAMGRYGGFELSYGSDADVLFVHDPRPGADAQLATGYATAVVGELRRLLALPGPDPALEVDAGLRPEGKQGPLVRSLDSYAAYYAKWSRVWEAQALLRADAVVGDGDLRRRFIELIDPLRYPEGGLSDDDVVEIRRIKARVDTERLPRGADRNTHLKLGRGGLSDIEWTVQLLQLRHGAQVPGLRTSQTLSALEGAREAGLVSSADAEILAEGWRTVSRIRNAITLVRGRAADQLPRDTRERGAVAITVGYPPGGSDTMVNDYLRRTRRTHRVVERVFWE